MCRCHCRFLFIYTLCQTVRPKIFVSHSDWKMKCEALRHFFFVHHNTIFNNGKTRIHRSHVMILFFFFLQRWSYSHLPKTSNFKMYVSFPSQAHFQLVYCSKLKIALVIWKMYAFCQTGCCNFLRWNDRIRRFLFQFSLSPIKLERMIDEWWFQMVRPVLMSKTKNKNKKKRNLMWK